MNREASGAPPNEKQLKTVLDAFYDLTQKNSGWKDCYACNGAAVHFSDCEEFKCSLCNGTGEMVGL